MFYPCNILVLQLKNVLKPKGLERQMTVLNGHHSGECPECVHLKVMDLI